MTKVKLGVIGYGNMGEAHCKNIFAGKVPNMKVTAIWARAAQHLMDYLEKQD